MLCCGMARTGGAVVCTGSDDSSPLSFVTSPGIDIMKAKCLEGCRQRKYLGSLGDHAIFLPYVYIVSSTIGQMASNQLSILGVNQNRDWRKYFPFNFLFFSMPLPGICRIHSLGKTRLPRSPLEPQTANVDYLPPLSTAVQSGRPLTSHASSL